LSRQPIASPVIPLPKLAGSPEKIFISVDESTGRSTLSFAPAGVGTPIPREDDKQGEQALRDARAIAATYPGCSIVGPHFHASTQGRPRPRRWR
jgi:hypothetical protein